MADVEGPLAATTDDATIVASGWHTAFGGVAATLDDAFIDANEDFLGLVTQSVVTDPNITKTRLTIPPVPRFDDTEIRNWLEQQRRLVQDAYNRLANISDRIADVTNNLVVSNNTNQTAINFIGGNTNISIIADSTDDDLRAALDDAFENHWGAMLFTGYISEFTETASTSGDVLVVITEIADASSALSTDLEVVWSTIPLTVTVSDFPVWVWYEIVDGVGVQYSEMNHYLPVGTWPITVHTGATLSRGNGPYTFRLFGKGDGGTATVASIGDDNGEHPVKCYRIQTRWTDRWGFYKTANGV